MVVVVPACALTLFCIRARVRALLDGHGGAVYFLVPFEVGVIVLKAHPFEAPTKVPCSCCFRTWGGARLLYCENKGYYQSVTWTRAHTPISKLKLAVKFRLRAIQNRARIEQQQSRCGSLPPPRTT